MSVAPHSTVNVREKGGEHTDLGAAGLVGREPLGGNVLRSAGMLLEVAHHRVEMLDVADLHEAAVLPRGG